MPNRLYCYSLTILLDEEKRVAEEEIGALRRHNERLEQMRRDKDTLLFQLMELTSGQMDKLSPEQRRRIYQKLGLVVTTRADGTLDICGELTDLSFGNLEVTQSSTAYLKVAEAADSYRRGSPPRCCTVAATEPPSIQGTNAFLRVFPAKYCF